MPSTVQICRAHVGVMLMGCVLLNAVISEAHCLDWLSSYSLSATYAVICCCASFQHVSTQKFDDCLLISNRTAQLGICC